MAAFFVGKMFNSKRMNCLEIFFLNSFSFIVLCFFNCCITHFSDLIRKNINNFSGTFQITIAFDVIFNL